MNKASLSLRNKIIIDTNVFVSTLGKPDIYTQTSRKFFQMLTGNVNIIIPILVIAETTISLYKQDPQYQHAALTHLENFNIVPIDIKALELLINLLQPTDLKTSDIIIALTTKLHQATLITWDKQLLSKTNTLCPTLTPTQFLNPTQN